MRVNRDDLRSMLFHTWKGKKEKVVTETEDAAVLSAVRAGYNVIIDDTNLNPKTVVKFKHMAECLGAKFEIKYFDTPVSVCVYRDSFRTGRSHVGRAVIENMALKYGKLPAIIPDKKVVIFDIDGTLADCMHRKTWLNTCKACHETEEFHTDPAHACEGFIPGGKQHKIFYSETCNDSPIWTVIEWARATYSASYENLIVSGRPTNMAGDATVTWLCKYEVPYRHLFMRAANDFRDDTIIKQEILDKILTWIPKEQILFVVDDRKRVCDMWRNNGLKVYPVPQDGIGDF